MNNSWIQFVKHVQQTENISFKDALILSKDLYSKGSSINSQKTAIIFMKNRDKFDINRVNNPSGHFKTYDENKRRDIKLKQIKNNLDILPKKKINYKTQFKYALSQLPKKQKKEMEVITNNVYLYGDENKMLENFEEFENQVDVFNNLPFKQQQQQQLRDKLYSLLIKAKKYVGIDNKANKKLFNAKLNSVIKGQLNLSFLNDQQFFFL
jgi:hypothetical protein